jgi:hypothetical protein
LRRLYEPLTLEKLSWSKFPLYVTSDRLAEHAHSVGYSSVTAMAGATDTAIINGLMTAFDRQGKGIP